MPSISCQLSFCAAFAIAAAADQPSTVFTFDDEPHGQLPTTWKAAKTGEGPGSEWKVVAYEAKGKPNQALAQTASDGPNPLFNICIRPDMKHGDIDLAVRIKPISGKRDQGGGLVWRYRDQNNYYVARWNPLEDNLRVYHVVDGKRTQLANADVKKLTSDQWHTIRSVQRGDRIQCYLNGNLLLDITDDTIRDAGAIGLWTKADAVTWFDDLTITSQDKK